MIRKSWTYCIPVRWFALGIMTWFYKYGLPGAIARDLLKKYKLAKNISSDDASDSEDDLMQTVIGMWLALNGPPIIMGKDGIDKKIRLEIKTKQWEEKPPKSLYELFFDILYIEAEISSEESKIYRDAGKVFVDEALKERMDFRQEHERRMLLLRRLGRFN